MTYEAISVKYQKEEQEIVNAVEQSPGWLSVDLAKTMAATHNVTVDAMQNLISRLLTKERLQFKRVTHDNKGTYALYPPGYRVEGTAVELTRIRQSKPKGRKALQAQQAQQELPLAKKWESAPLPPKVFTPAPAPAPRVVGLPVIVNNVTHVIPASHMRAAYDMLRSVYEG